MSILISSALLIGPVNYWLLWRRRRQVLLVLTAPLISAIFIVLLAGYVLAGEGFGVRGRAVTFTMLDQVGSRPSRAPACRCTPPGMTPSAGCVSARRGGVPDRHRRHRQPRTADARSHRVAAVLLGRHPGARPANFEEIGFRPARERLELQPRRPAASASSTDSGRRSPRCSITTAARCTPRRPVAAGGTGDPDEPASRSAMPSPAGLPLSSRFGYLFEHQPDGSYLAVLERSPFWEPGVSRRRRARQLSSRARAGRREQR